MINLKSKDIPSVRNKILAEQNYTCPLCGKHITDSDRITLDHQHKYRKSDENGVDGNGLVRGVLCADCNVAEGKTYNALTRFLNQPSKHERIQWLKRLIDYYEKEPYPYVHPSEVKKEQDISKRQFNLLNKQYKLKYPSKKPLEYPKSCKLTKKLKLLFEEFMIEPFINK